MYTGTANAEKIYLKTQISKEIFIRNYEESYLNKLNSLNCTKYRNSPHEELPAHKMAATQRRTQNFVRWGGINSVEDRGQRERGSGDGRPLIRGSGGSYNLVQEILFPIVNVS